MPASRRRRASTTSPSWSGADRRELGLALRDADGGAVPPLDVFPLDVTGVLTATIFAIAGWLIIPARRRHLISEFEKKIEKLNEDLAGLLKMKFEEQLTRYESQLLEVVAPYERFLETERSRLETGLGDLRGAETEVSALENRVSSMFPDFAA